MEMFRLIPKGTRVRGAMSKSWYVTTCPCGIIPCDARQTVFKPNDERHIVVLGALRSERTGQTKVVLQGDPWIIYKVESAPVRVSQTLQQL